MKIQAIASDFDGTILRPGDLEVRKELFSIIEELKEKNIGFIAASGRQYFNLRRLMKPVMNDISYVCENGAMVISGGKVISKSVIDRAEAFMLIKDMEKVQGADIVVSGEDTFYMTPDNVELICLIRDKIGNNLTVINEFVQIKRDMIKISIHWSCGIPKEEELLFKEKYGHIFQIVDGGNGWLDFTKLGTNKGAALKILSEYLGYDMERIISIGDSENDISMLQETGYSYVMHTAREFVKEAGSEICVDAVETIGSICKNQT